jgi:hypothetical protein
MLSPLNPIRFTPPRYALVTLNNGKRIYLRIVKDGAYLRGIRVGRDGDEIITNSATHLYILSRDDIRRRVDMEMSLKYGYLVKQGEARKGL